MVFLARLPLVSVEPLRLWAVVEGMCAVMLLILAVTLWIVSGFRTSQMGMRIVAILAMLAAVGAEVVASRTWSAYLLLSPGVPGRSPPPESQTQSAQLVRDATSLYLSVVWLVVLITVALLAVGTLLAYRTRHERVS